MLPDAIVKLGGSEECAGGTGVYNRRSGARTAGRRQAALKVRANAIVLFPLAAEATD